METLRFILPVKSVIKSTIKCKYFAKFDIQLTKVGSFDLFEVLKGGWLKLEELTNNSFYHITMIFEQSTSIPTAHLSLTNK